MLLAEQNPYISGETSLFNNLVCTGEEKACITLPIQMHLFLVNCLVEHLRDYAIAHHILALGFLEASTKRGESGNIQLKRTGDAALLLAGLFPERSIRLHVSSTYFRHMGQAAYASLSAKHQAAGRPIRGTFFREVTEHFQHLERVLNAVRLRPSSEWWAFQRYLAYLQYG